MDSYVLTLTFVPDKGNQQFISSYRKTLTSRYQYGPEGVIYP
jgi:hypothetical protein